MDVYNYFQMVQQIRVYICVYNKVNMENVSSD